MPRAFLSQRARSPSIPSVLALARDSEAMRGTKQPAPFTPFPSTVSFHARNRPRQMRYNIDSHDYDVRLRAAQDFLRRGDKVKLTVQFRGREMEFKVRGAARSFSL